jgi:mannose-1-phosphate guanylyltransferase
MQTLDNILSIIMGGGRGSRLYPLTRDRAKPAVPWYQFWLLQVCSAAQICTQPRWKESKL